VNQFIEKTRAEQTTAALGDAIEALNQEGDEQCIAD
jgi:hypothetical protein